MPLFKTILVAADFSENSREAFRLASLLAPSEKTRLIVLHAVEPPIIHGYTEMGFPLPQVAEERANREAVGGRLQKAYASDLPLQVEYRIREGYAADEILRVAQEVGADLIVLGTHGRTGLIRLLAGSVAEVVLRQAQCPVLALRSPSRLAAEPDADVTTRTPEKKPGAGLPEKSKVPQDSDLFVLPIRTILHPTDFSPSSEAALHVAYTLAREFGARLMILHAAPMETVYGGIFPGVPTEPGIYQHALEKQLHQIRIPEPEEGPTPGPAVLVEHRLKEGDAATEILQFADEIGADLIVMGSHGRTGLGRVLFGSVAEAVLRHAHCPVLTLKSTPSEHETQPEPNKSNPVWTTLS